MDDNTGPDSKEPKMEDDNDDQFCPARYPIRDVRGNRHGRFGRSLPAFFRGHDPRIAARLGATAVFLLALLAGVVAPGGHASARDYGLVAMNFDLWCQEEEHLPAHRCDQRTAVDEKAFEDFQHIISPYEAQNLRAAEQEQWLERDFMENDPVDHPMTSSLAAPQSSLPRSVDNK
jgi:hypothetical protein